MKKKMLFMAAIAGLISLGSCVKDDVSSSVEAVRNAKANELNAKANEHNANAALAQAQADLTKATQAAEVALKNAQAASAQAAAEAAQMANEVTAAALEDQIANTIADYKAQLAGNQALLQTNLNAVEAALRTAKANDYAELQRLTNDYATAYAALNGALATLLADELALEGAKENYEYAMKSKENQINANKKQIEQNQKLIEKLTELKEKIEAGASAEELAAEAQAMNAATDIEAAAFGESAEVQALKEASENLAAAYFAYKLFTADMLAGDAFDGAFTKLNNAVAAQGWVSAIDGITPITEYYTASAGETIYSDDLLFGVIDDFSYNMTVTPRVATPSYTGATMATIVPNEYTLSEGAKFRMDEYLATYSDSKKDDVKAAQKAVDEAIDLLGTKSDTKDTKTTLPGNKVAGKQVPTLYANLAKENEELAAAKTAEATAKENKTKLPAAVKAAFKDLWDVYDKSSSTAKDKATALYKFAKAYEAAYGEAAYNHLPASIDLTLAGDQDEVVNYMLGASGHSFATEYAAKLDVEKLMATGSPVFVGTAFVTVGSFDIDDLDTYFEGITGAVTTTRKAGAKDVNQIYTDAQTALGAATDAPSTTGSAYAQQKFAQNAVNDKPYEIADLQDVLVDAEAKLATAEEDKAELEALIDACDPEKYAEVVAAGVEAAADFNEAAAAAVAAMDAIDDKYAEAAALAGAWTTDIDDQIKQAEDDIAFAEQAIKNWEAANSQAQLVAAAAAQVEADKAAVQQAEIDLAAAKAALEAAVGDIDPEEPAEEPETPEEPAEGGEETPAEGEGETPAEGEGE